MNDASTALRTGYYSLLSGSVEYDSTPVGVFDGKVENIAGIDEGVWIILGEQTENDISNKSKFVTEQNIEIIIANKTTGVAGKEIVDEVANSIMGVVKPTVGTHGITIASPFIITYVKYEGGRASRVSQDVSHQFDNVKTLNFRNRITQ